MKLSEDLQERWERIEEKFSLHFGKKPDLETILMLIGVQELRNSKTKFNKEEKQDLMHIAICTVLSDEGYYRLSNYDKEGWPHFEKLKSLPSYGVKEQEEFLKRHIVLYFDKGPVN